ncbi:MAG: hypothetical protein ACFFG0_30335 [Candidatus Thorarchaeota archaeon]
MIRKENINSKGILPRLGSTLYNLNNPDEKIRENTLKKYKRVNKYLVIPLYRIKILLQLGFGKIILLLITIGRRTGKKRRIPLEYHWIDCIIQFFQEEEKIQGG